MAFRRTIYIHALENMRVSARAWAANMEGDDSLVDIADYLSIDGASYRKQSVVFSSKWASQKQT
jgi:hypothetical protein